MFCHPRGQGLKLQIHGRAGIFLKSSALSVPPSELGYKGHTGRLLCCWEDQTARQRSGLLLSYAKEEEYEKERRTRGERRGSRIEIEEEEEDKEEKEE